MSVISLASTPRYHGGHALDMRAEVALHRRAAPGRAGEDAPSIRLRGVDSTRWDFQFKVMRLGL